MLPVFAATRTGLVDLSAPEPGRISLGAIAHGLAQINCWVGSAERIRALAQAKGGAE